MHKEEIGKDIVECAMKVHSALGPGLLESAYETCLAHELQKRWDIRRQVVLPLEYDGIKLDAGYRIDLLVENCVVVELKAVEKLNEVHFAQLLSYLRLGNYNLGFLLNFNVQRMKHGIRRVVNNN
ncbi:MAG: GxxExxY protein [Gammaproteobacteria bacterium]|jgi:GxxExxY protein|nr:GxxExxY protein [Gammaproteobacteria bacterium]